MAGEELIWSWIVRLTICIWFGHKWSSYHWIEFDTLLCERCAKEEEHPRKAMRKFK